MDNNYLTIQGWMVSKLGLSSNDLLTYALIYGFCQDGESEFTGSINYITKWLNCSRPTAIKTLKNLTDKELLFKSVITMNGVSFNRYKVNLEVVKKLNYPSNNDDLGSKETLLGVVKKLNGGSKETLPNNTNNTILDNNKIDFDALLIFFNNTLGKKITTFGDAKAKINKRLQEGFKKEDFKNTILNIKDDPFAKENNYKYVTLEYISRVKTLQMFSHVPKVNNSNVYVAQNDLN